MWIGWIELDLLLGDVRSLKEKRRTVQPIIAELRRVAPDVAEVADQDLLRRARIGASVVSGEAAHAARVLDALERIAAARPDAELLSARRGLVDSED